MAHMSLQDGLQDEEKKFQEKKQLRKKTKKIKRKKKLLIFLGMVLVIVPGTLFFLFSKEEEPYEVRYYETFRYVQNSEKHQILFIEQLSQKETPERRHIRVYFNTQGEWVFLESFNQKGEKVRSIKNTLSIQSTEL